MNDYGEIIKLPYKVEDIYKVVKKLLKYDKIRHISLQNADDENREFNLVFKTIFKKSKINIKLIELENEVAELSLYSSSNSPIDFNGNRQIIKKIVSIIFKELEECTKTSSDDFSVSIIQKMNSFKSFINFIAIAFLAFLVFYFIFISIDSIASRNDDDNKWVFIVMAIFFGLVYSILYKIVRIFKRKMYCKKRITKIKRMLYHLIEDNSKKRYIDSKSLANKTTKKISVMPSKVNSYIDRGINYIKKTKNEKPKVFWMTAVTISVIVTWSMIKIISSPTHINGVFIQQLDGYTGHCAAIPDEITFQDGFVYGSGAESTYQDKEYKYKIKGNKIYIIKNGKEVFSELTIKNKNTLIYGDGVVDEQYFGTKVKVCGVNGDGIYVKQ